MKAVILQSNYIPWIGYFDMMQMADVFVIYDEVQYTKNDWRNRNKIKTPQGLQWLTIPVQQEKLAQKINETKVANNAWRKKHWNALKINYAKAPCFKEFGPIFEHFYLNTEQNLISEVNYGLFLIINDILGIQTKLLWSTDFQLVQGKTEKLVDICKQVGATTYISGPAAKDYLETDLFNKENITIHWMHYDAYKPYHQLYPPFLPGASIVDLIFNEGKNARYFLKSFNIV